MLLIATDKTTKPSKVIKIDKIINIASSIGVSPDLISNYTMKKILLSSVICTIS